jgi:hypothetical protein
LYKIFPLRGNIEKRGHLIVFCLRKKQFRTLESWQSGRTHHRTTSLYRPTTRSTNERQMCNGATSTPQQSTRAVWDVVVKIIVFEKQNFYFFRKKVLTH